MHNPKEAEAVVDLIARLVDDPANREKTIGVIVLQGSRQIRLIEDLINQRIPAPARTSHAIRIGNPAQFQGDERHIVILSMVVSDPARITGGHRSEQQAYNVAASRAQDQMHLVYSVPRHRLKTGDLRLNLLSYMENPPAVLADADDIGPVSPDTPHPTFDSLFEQRVYLRIKERGYHVIPQFPAGDKRIDLVVIGARSRLAVECDGDYFHNSSSDDIRRDQLRERELQRVGWTFWRLRDSDFRRNPDQALAGLWDELDRHGIHPAHFHPSQPTTHAGDTWKPLDLPDPIDDDPEPNDIDDDTAGGTQDAASTTIALLEGTP